MTLPFVAFVAVFVLVASAGSLLFYRQAMLKRLSSVVPSPSAPTGGTFHRLRQIRSRTSVAGLMNPFQKVLPRSLEEVSVVQKRLIRAGYRKDSFVNVFYGSKVLIPLFLAGLATVTRAYESGPFFVYGVAIAIGFLLPDFFLGNRIAARKLNIRLGLPDALDLMVICVEAGLGMDQVFHRVAEELRISQPEISDELSLVTLEQRAGRSRAESWKHFAERTDVAEVRGVVATLVQADKFGTSVARALRAHSETLRTRRRQQTEEDAAKTTVKLVFPLVFFIFPSLFVVALGPAMIIMLEGFEKYLLS